MTLGPPSLLMRPAPAIRIALNNHPEKTCNHG